MARVVLAPQLARWLPGDAASREASLHIEGATLAAVLDRVFEQQPALRGYVCDERGVVRHHVAIFVDGASIRDKQALDVPLGANAEVYLAQALSGG